MGAGASAFGGGGVGDFCGGVDGFGGDVCWDFSGTLFGGSFLGYGVDFSLEGSFVFFSVLLKSEKSKSIDRKIVYLQLHCLHQQRNCFLLQPYCRYHKFYFNHQKLYCMILSNSFSIHR